MLLNPPPGLRPLLVLLLLVSLSPAAAPLPAQALPDDGWNAPAVLSLVERGITRRSTEVVDTALQSYTAQGRGFVYFLLDAPEIDRQSLVRTDQVALEVYWRSPNEVRQRIVGLREQRELPVTRLHYYLDRLTVVQDNYGQAIVIADGDNVNDVPHPVGAGAPVFYDYRLSDSLTLRLPGVPDPVRVHEIQVRPRDASIPAIVGSVYLEAETGALVRMAFTFTPSAYIDPRLDFIHVTLENGLWRGRYWLPHEQRLEIRRELPELDLPFGTIIRTRMRIGESRFNEAVPEWLFLSRLPVTMVPREERERFRFDQPIDAEWRAEGIGRPLDVAGLRREAGTLAHRQAMSGLPRNRPSIPAASDLFRYNRAEGAVVGAGWTLRARDELDARLYGGWAFGPGRPLPRLDLVSRGPARAGISVYAGRARDTGGFAIGSVALNTLDALLLAGDHTDPFYAAGANAELSLPPVAGWSIRAGARAERQRSADLTSTFSLFGRRSEFRPVHPIDDGTHLSLALSAVRGDRTTAAGGGWAEARVRATRLQTAGEALYAFRPEVAAGHDWSRSERRASLELQGRAGWSIGDVPRQDLVLLGGRGTLPGFGFRAFGGDRFALVSGMASADLSHPWLRGRVFGAVGAVGAGEGAARSMELRDVTGSRGPRASIGTGVGLFYDLLRIDLGRGLGSGGGTELIVEFQRAFWDLL